MRNHITAVAIRLEPSSPSEICARSIPLGRELESRMDPRPRLQRWQHRTWRGGGGAEPPTSSTTSSATGISVGGTAAGAPTSHAPGNGYATRTSGTHMSGIGPLASNGTSPIPTRPPSMACGPHRFKHPWMSVSHPYAPVVDCNSAGAPAGYRHDTSHSAASPARRQSNGVVCLLLVCQGPPSCLLGGARIGVLRGCLLHASCMS